jgi:flagellar biosynthesis protein FlhG
MFGGGQVKWILRPFNTEQIIMPVIYPIGGGKGGVGKSFMVASLGASLAMRGNRVALVDLDLGASNLHTLLGIKTPCCGLNTFIDKKADTLESVAVPTHIAGLSLISSCQCQMEIANLYFAQKTRLINAIKKMSFDVILLDVGAGTNYNTIDFFMTSDSGVVICTPEPTSIENTFGFINAVYLRRLKQIIRTGGYSDALQKSIMQNGNSELSAGAIFKFVEEQDRENLDQLKAQLERNKFHIIINQHRKFTDPELGSKMETVCNRHFYSPFRYIGHVDFDERVHEAVYQRKLFVELFPNTATSADIKKITRELTRNKAASLDKRGEYEKSG